MPQFKSPINDLKPLTISQITKYSTTNDNRVKNTNPYKMKQNDILTSNVNIPYRYSKSTSIQHYYDEPTHVPSYQKKRYRTDSMGFLNQVEILRNFTKKMSCRYRNMQFVLFRIRKQNKFFLHE